MSLATHLRATGVLLVALSLGPVARAAAPLDFDERLKSFAAEQEVLVRTLAAKQQVRVESSVGEFFSAAKAGEWKVVTNKFRPVSTGTPQWDFAKPHPAVAAGVWPAIADVGLATEVLVKMLPRYVAILTHDLTAGLPPGAITLAGTDAGFLCPTVFSRPLADGEKRFTLHQSSLTAAGQFYLPGKFDDTIKVLPDADERQRGRAIFEANPNREFFVVEGFPVDWMYPHLTPHGAVLKLNRERIGTLTEEILMNDRSFWSGRIKQFLGADFAPPVTVKEVCDFVDRAYGRRDLKGFAGDPRYLQNETAQAVYSKLRVAIAGNYSWRAGRSASEPAEQQRMNAAADGAFLQAFALCPTSQEVLFRYLNLLIALHRHDDALLLVDLAVKLAPQNRSLEKLRPQLENLKAGVPLK